MAEPLTIAAGGLELITGLFGGGGLRDCERYGADALQQLQGSFTARDAERGWSALGGEKARALLAWADANPQSTFCRTGQVSIACEGSFDGAAFDASLSRHGITVQDGIRAAEAMGLPADQGCSETLQVAALGLSRYSPPELEPDVTASGLLGGVNLTTVAVVVLVIAVGALFWMQARR